MTKVSDIKRCIGEPDFSRGQTYFNQGKVFESAVIASDQVVGAVQGSYREEYVQNIHLERDRFGKLVKVEGHCSCPVSYNCKHVVATLLHALPDLPSHARSVKKQSSRPLKKLSLPVSTWLSGINNITSHDLTAVETNTSPENIYYIFRRQAGQQGEINTVKARTLKSGGFGKSVRDFDPANFYNRGRFLQFEDIGILSKLEYLTDTFMFQSNDSQSPQEMMKLCQEIMATRRAKLNSVHGIDLFWSTPKKASFSWTNTKTGTQKIKIEIADGKKYDIIPLSFLLYANPESGECGYLETGLPDELAVKFASAPDIPVAEAATVSKALSRVETVKLPTPQTLETIERKVTPVAKLKLFGQKVKMPDLTYQKSGYWGVYHHAKIQRTIPVVRPTFEYEGHKVSFDDDDDAQVLEGDKIVRLVRDLEAEVDFLEAMEAICGEFDGFPLDEFDWGITPANSKWCGEEDIVFALDRVEGENFQETSHDALRFMTMGLDLLYDNGWEVEIDKSWKWRLHEGDIDISAQVESSETDWFSFALKLKVGDQELDILPLILNIIKDLPLDLDGTLPPEFSLAEFIDDIGFFATLKNGTSVALPGEQLAPIVNAFLETQGLLARHPAESDRVFELAEALEGCGIPWQGGEQILSLGKKLRELTNLSTIQPPKALKGTLRDYQKLGYGWLNALCDCGFGGLLADDMGLGKTIQALSLLLQRHVEHESDRPSLLVVPTSLIGNWLNEAKKFAPQLRMLTLHGPDRKEHFDKIPDHDVVITTYPLLNRDHESLFAHKYDLALLDEAQAVKNPAASVAKKIRDIDARQRIAITGTPVENNLQELWAVFDWLIPGLLGDRKTFTKHFRTPIEKHDDQEAQRLLTARVKPFLLRRTKEEVATDLPAKTEINELVRLHEDQNRLYESIRIAMNEKVRDAIAKRGLAQSHITILDALLKLRQVCCDPELVKLDNAKKLATGAKRIRLMELLEELVAEGRKVLVFSQFVEMLKLIEQDVRAKHWKYAMLTGQTKKRQEQIDMFQQGDAQIFLISLKAGGVGLNLTAADTVIIFDPWWNPAVERQAMDRTHRIGQDKSVFVYKLIAEGSVEAAIQEMQTRKQALADALFEGGGSGAVSLEDLDIEQLFSPLSA